MNKLKKFIGLLLQFIYETTNGVLFFQYPAPVVISKRRVYTGEMLHLVRYASKQGGFYRVILKDPDPVATRAVPWIGRRLDRDGAVASFSRLSRRLA